MMSRELNLCLPCAEKLKGAFSLRKIRGGVDNKITCDECRKKRYGATYSLEGKK